MSIEQFKAFVEKVKSDSSLQERISGATSREDVVSIAKEHGHEFTADKISKSNLLSDKELEGVAGGYDMGPVGNSWDDCPQDTADPRAGLLGNGHW